MAVSASAGPACRSALSFFPTMTKTGAALPGSLQPHPRRPRWSLMSAIVFSVACFYLFSTFSAPLSSSCRVRKVDSDTEMCPQANPLVPRKNASLWKNLTAQYTTDSSLARAVAQLSTAVKVPTETFDAMGPVGVDPRWESRDSFIDHLENAFPLVYVPSYRSHWL
jgi:hypothetical protein